MSHNTSPHAKQLTAPCIVDTGTIVNQRDMQRLLADLDRIRYFYFQDGVLASQGEGYILEVFADPQRATLIANHSLYINLNSFDYLELSLTPEQEAQFDLIQDDRQLRLIPLTNPLQEQSDRQLDAATLEAVVAEVLSASWDVHIDDEEHFSF